MGKFQLHGIKHSCRCKVGKTGIRCPSVSQLYRQYL
ncbi:hypothetical protein CGRA01v4_03823 [Colletotrichum graminicola]|nr:hypothetical protein CGRA01v4_03823 [Colletotrichum graminicola]